MHDQYQHLDSQTRGSSENLPRQYNRGEPEARQSFQHPNHAVGLPNYNSPQYPQNLPQGLPYDQAMGDDLNSLVSTASPLITLITQLRHTIDHPNVAALRAQVVEEIKTFEHKLVSIEYPVRTIVAARYCLCTAIDEAVLSRPWGTQSVWIQGSLLSLFHKETWGGERFYIILEDMLRDLRKNIDFVELVYFLLSLGFEGKFYGTENRAAREEIRNRIFYHIRHARSKPERVLSPHGKLFKMPKTSREKKNKLRKFAWITLIILVVIGSFFNYRLHRKAMPTVNQLDSIAQVPPITIFSQIIQRDIIPRNDRE